jgi:uncharacterized protein YukE
MGNALTDPRAQDLLNTSPEEIDRLAGFFQKVSSQANTSSSALRGAHGDLNWTGNAADAFRQQLGKLPSDLDTIDSSYAKAAAAVRTYASQVAPVKSRFQTLYNELSSEQSSLGTAQARASSAQTAYSQAAGAKGAKPTDSAVTGAHTTLTTAQGALTTLQNEMGTQNTTALHLLDEFDTLRGACRSAVQDAAGQAPQHHSSLFGSIAHFVDNVGHFVGGVAKNIGESFKNVFDGHDIIDFVEHPSWKTFGRLAGDVATVAGVIALVAAPFAAPELLEADAAVDGAEGAAAGSADAAGEGAADGAAGAAGAAGGDGAGEGAETVGRVQRFREGARTTNEVAGNVAKQSNAFNIGAEVGQGHYKDAGIDTAFTALGAGDRFVNKLGVGDDAAEEDKTAFTKTTDYQTLRTKGYSDPLAKQVAFGDGEIPESLKNGMPTPEQITTTLEEQAGEYNKATSRALHIGQPLAGIVDSLGVDPVKDKIKDALSPRPIGAAG